MRRVPKLSVGAARTGARKSPAPQRLGRARRKHLRLQLGFRLDLLSALPAPGSTNFGATVSALVR